MTTHTDSVHISSLVIHCLPEKLLAIMDSVKQIENIDIGPHDPCGKLVVVLETESEQGIMTIIDKIQSFKGVITTSMVYHELDC